MIYDPLFDPIREGRALTAGEVERALRWRLVQIQRLDSEIRALRALQDRLVLEAEVRAERDPPIEEPERTYH